MMGMLVFGHADHQ